MTDETPQNEKAGKMKEDPYVDCRVILDVFDRVGDKWTMMVVGALSDGPTRFNAVKRAIDGISHRILTLTLRGLERDGIISRTVYPTVPPKVEYELTDLGRSLIEPLNALANWSLKNKGNIEEARAIFDGGSKLDS
jgi:DNA-binding HxlR family transcriptional regulator